MVTSRAGPFCARVQEIARQMKPDVVLMTMSPFCLASLVGPLRSVTDARIVVDLRDPWALDYWPVYGTASRLRAQRRVMSNTLARVDGVIMNTPAARDDLTENFTDLMKSGLEERVTVITNGYTGEDFAGATGKSSSDRLQIMHAGTFHCEYLYPERSLSGRLRGAIKKSRAPIDRKGRTPYFLLRAAFHLKSNEPSIFEDIEFQFDGHVDELLERSVADSGVAEKVTLEGYVPHEQTVRNMCSAGALFLPGAGLPPDVEDLIIPGKTYEYLASGRPIIAALPAGDARELLAQAGGDYPCEPCSVDSIVLALKRLHADWKAGRCNDLLKVRAPVLASYERSVLAGELASFLARIKNLAHAYVDD